MTADAPEATRSGGNGSAETGKVAETANAERAGGKGRPTPRRREAEQRNRQPLIGGGRPVLGPNATKEERKAAKEARREVLRTERAAQRQALITGDESRLPARDKGPARRFARDYVDARRSLGEYFMPFAIVILLGNLVLRASWLAQTVGVLLLYAVMIIVAVDAFLLRRRVTKLVTQRFGTDQAAGVGGYAMMRSLQIRRTRLPKPQVARGQFPQ